MSSPDDNMTRPISRVIWAYAQALRRKGRRDELPEADWPADFLQREAQMEKMYHAVMCLRWQEVDAYAKSRGLTLVYDGKPINLQYAMCFLSGFIALTLERKRVGDETFFGEDMVPPPEERE